ELDPDNEEGRLQLAALLQDQALPPEALTHLEYLIRKRPQDPDVLVRLARCRMALGQADEAGAILGPGLPGHPHSPPALCSPGGTGNAAKRPGRSGEMAARGP